MKPVQAGRPGLKERVTHSFPVRVAKRYLDAQGPNWATLIAWNALFAFFPMVLITVTVIGLVLQNPGLQSGLEQQVAKAFPNKQNQQDILGALHSFKQNSGLFAIIGFAGLLWSGSALFGAIEQGLCALNNCRPRDFVKQKLMAFSMILLFTVLAVPLVLSSSLLPALQSINFLPSFLTSGPAALLIQLGGGVLDGTLLFTAIYYVVPNRKQRLRDVLPGALTAGVLLEGFTLLFPTYFKLANGFATYGATFALFFLLLTYFFFLGQITMIGGAVNAERQLSREQARHAVTAIPPESAVHTALPGKAIRERAERAHRA
jgi:membrane protein